MIGRKRCVPDTATGHAYPRELKRLRSQFARVPRVIHEPLVAFKPNNANADCVATCLPVELWAVIGSFITDERDALALRTTCQALYALFSSDTLWSAIVHDQYGPAVQPVTARNMTVATAWYLPDYRLPALPTDVGRQWMLTWFEFCAFERGLAHVRAVRDGSAPPCCAYGGCPKRRRARAGALHPRQQLRYYVDARRDNKKQVRILLLGCSTPRDAPARRARVLIRSTRV